MGMAYSPASKFEMGTKSARPKATTESDSVPHMIVCPHLCAPFWLYKIRTFGAPSHFFFKPKLEKMSLYKIHFTPLFYRTSRNTMPPSIEYNASIVVLILDLFCTFK